MSLSSFLAWGTGEGGGNVALVGCLVTAVVQLDRGSGRRRRVRGPEQLSHLLFRK